MYDIIVFENDKPAFSKKPTLVTIFGKLFFFFFFSSGGGGRGPENAVYETYLPSPCTAFSQSLSVNSFQWRIRDERAGKFRMDHVTWNALAARKNEA